MLFSLFTFFLPSHVSSTVQPPFLRLDAVSDAAFPKCACVYARVHVCACVCMCVCTCVDVHVCGCVCMRMHVCCMCACVCMCARVCAEAGAACCQLRTGNMAERTGCRRLPVHLWASTGGSFVTLGMEAWLVQV